MSEYVILGSNGVLGSALHADLLKKDHQVSTFTRENLDINDIQQVRKVLGNHPLAIIVNCIAYMPADKCETNPDESQMINRDFVEVLSQLIASNSEQKLLHFSSDFVFDGKQNKPYKIEDFADPLNTYGRHKLESEVIVERILGQRSRIIRFASLVGISKNEKTFLERIIAKANQGGSLSIIDDLVISIATTDLVAQVVSNAFSSKDIIIHAVHQGETTWHELATTALEIMKITVACKKAKHDDFPTIAKRPMYSVLEPNLKFLNNLELNWKIGLKEFIEKNYA
jgi:dTDP-4-dehydrorhamnose reductase